MQRRHDVALQGLGITGSAASARGIDAVPAEHLEDLLARICAAARAAQVEDLPLRLELGLGLVTDLPELVKLADHLADVAQPVDLRHRGIDLYRERIHSLSGIDRGVEASERALALVPLAKELEDPHGRAILARMAVIGEQSPQLSHPLGSTLVVDVETAISVRDLRKAYGSHEAVRGISFEVGRGEVFGFLGANGAGKTTTIEILEGYRERSSGSVEVLGVDPGKPTRRWRERIGLVLQECDLNPSMTVAETVGLFARFYPHARGVGETIELVGLGEKADERIGSLSGGQRRRVDVALGIIGDPDLLFLDEPTTGFDPSARRGAWKMIEGLKALGKTIFLTTHYMEEAQQLADRVAILRGGELVALGTTEELGGGLGQRTVVRFRLPAGVEPKTIATVAGDESETVGGVVSIRTADAQRTLFRLTAWAEREGLGLDGLEAIRPSLEDVFIAMTGEGDRSDG